MSFVSRLEVFLYGITNTKIICGKQFWLKNKKPACSPYLLETRPNSHDYLCYLILLGKLKKKKKLKETRIQSSFPFSIVGTKALGQ